MMPKRKKQIARLDELVVRCKDDSHLFRDAAQAAGARHGEHRAELLALSRRRSAFAAALSSLVKETGGAPSTRGSLSCWTFRGLFGIRVSMLGGAHLGDSLAACARQESGTAELYRDVLLLGWSSEVEDILLTQLGEVEQSHSRVVFLRGHC